MLRNAVKKEEVDKSRKTGKDKKARGRDGRE